MYSPMEASMSNKQLERFITKATTDKRIKAQVLECGLDKTCIAEVGHRYGHKFSPANVGHWQRDHGGSLLSAK